jgi:predicted YcjX-like family ATPase
LPVIIGTPLAGETIGKRDASTATVKRRSFPGTCRTRPDAVFQDFGTNHRQDANERADPLRALPSAPKLERTSDGVSLSLPHIRLDRALQFLHGRPSGMSAPRQPAPHSASSRNR